MSVAFTPTRRRIDVAQYLRMAETGILAADEHVELLDGEILTMPPISPGHEHVVGELLRLIMDLLPRERATVRCQSSFALSRDSAPQPDLLVLRPKPDGYGQALPLPADIYLLVEVADTSLRYDSTRKLALYARHGVPEYWIVDQNARQLRIYRDPSGDRYHIELTLSNSEAAHCAALPDVAIDWGSSLVKPDLSP